MPNGQITSESVERTMDEAAQVFEQWLDFLGRDDSRVSAELLEFGRGNFALAREVFIHGFLAAKAE